MNDPSFMQYVQPIDLDKCYRLINIGPTTLISAQHQESKDVMAAAWSGVIDYHPTKVSVVLAKESYTRHLIEQSGYFVMQIPVVRQAELTIAVGSHSMREMPDKLTQLQVPLFYQPGFALPLVSGCAGWMVCELIPEPENQRNYDLFIGQVVAAWADSRVYRDNHWHQEEVDESQRTLHYVAGGHFYTLGKPVIVDSRD